MANNDSFLIDGIIDNIIEDLKVSTDRGKIFEHFCAQQITKDYCISNEEVNDCSVDGRNDGGVDFAFIFINGHLLKDPANFFWPRSNVEIENLVITSKHQDTFKQAPLDSIVATIQDIYNFRLNEKDFSLRYNNRLLTFRENLKFAYRKTSSRLTGIHFRYYYVSRGDTKSIGEEVVCRAEQIKEITKEYFSHAQVDFNFFGSTELIELSRKLNNFSLELPFIEVLSRGERYVLLSSLTAYFSFITDENGKLRRYLFDSNVRDYMGLNRVNEDIKSTLENEDSPDFWWLNNGITIIARTATVVGDKINIEDVQIVNGLQTSESIYNYFRENKDRNDRAVLIKVIVIKDEDVKDAIIKATNNQTQVEIPSLHATDKIQKDIEAVLYKSGFYYERRINYYKNQNIDQAKIVTPLYVASGYMGLVLKLPYKATKLRSRFMRDSSAYNRVFCEADLKVWPIIVHILKYADKNISQMRPTVRNSEGFLKKWRYIISFLTIAYIYKDYNYTISQLISLDLNKLNGELFNLVWNYIKSKIPSDGQNKKYLRNNDVYELLSFAAADFDIQNLKSISGRKFITNLNKNKILSEDFLEKVDSLLPEQPWKPGIHNEVIKKLKCTKSEYFSATQVLIDRGRRYMQKDGIVYFNNGEIKCIDADRVDAKTLQLKI